MTVYVTSDTHFNHAGIIHYTSRPFTSVREMNEHMIEAWNSTVGPRDDIYVLGDFGFHDARGIGMPIGDIWNALAGRKHLVVGNHDEKNDLVLKLDWKTQTPLTTIRHEGMRFIACHYPLETWKNAQRGYVMLHGHSHGTLQRVIPHRFDVGVDVRGFAPLPLERYWQLAEQETYSPQDHHGS